jgi:uncharacterized protein YciI
MQFILIAHDKPGALPLRMATRPAHLAWCTASFGESLIYGGPLLDEDGKPKGSVLVIEAADETAARAAFAADPYALAGLFDATTVTPIRQVFGHGKLTA